MSYPAYYNDGKTATRQTVTCALGNRALAIVANDGTVLARWPLDDIRYAGEKTRFREVGNEARVSLVSGDDGRWLTDHCPKLKKGDGSGAGWRTWTVAGGLAVISLVGIFTFLIPSFASMVVRAIPVTMEQEIGEQSRDQMLQFLSGLSNNSIECRETDSLQILQRRADEIATQLDSPFPIQLTVVKLGIPNAFALPGGQVVLLSGLLFEAENGDEVVGVLAHEIAHVVRRDAMTVSLQQTGTALLVSLLIGDVFGGSVLTGIGSSIIETGYSREAEAAADALAVQALNQLGLTARPLGDFLERITEKSDGLSSQIPEFLSTHPAAADRAREIERLSNGSGRAMTKFEWDRVRAMCAR